MKTFSLSTCLTVVLMLFCFPAIGADAQIPQGDCFKPETPEMKAECAVRAKLKNELLQEQINELKKKNSLGDCRAQSDAFTKAVREYNKSCGSAEPLLKRLVPIMGRPDEMTCAGLIRKCQSCTKGSCDSDILADDYDDESSASATTLGAGGSSSNYNKEVLESFKSCEPPSAEEMTSAREAFKDYRRERSKLEKEARDAQLDITKVAQSQTEAKNKLDDQAEAMQLRMEEKQRALKAAARERENKIKEVILKIEADVKGLEINMERLNLQRVEADITLAEALTQLDNQCHATALAKVEEHRKQILKQIETSNYTPGGQGNLFSGVGKSMKQKFKKLASEYFKECQNSELTKNLKQAARNRKSLADSRAQAEIRGMQDAIKRLQAQAKELQTTERQAALQEQLEAIQALQKEANANYTKLERRRGEVASETGMKMMEASQKLSQAQADLARESRDVEMDQALVSVGKTYRLGRAGDKPESIGNASRDLFLAQAAAAQAAQACCAAPATIGGGIAGSSTGPNSPACKNACAYIGDESEGTYDCPSGSIGTGGVIKKEKATQ